MNNNNDEKEKVEEDAMMKDIWRKHALRIRGLLMLDVSVVV